MNAENDWQKFGLNFAVHFFNIKHETCTLKKLLVKCHTVMLNFDETRNVKILCPDRFTNSGPVSEKVTTKTMHSSAWNDEPPNIGTSTSKRFPRTGLNAGESTTPRSSCLELNFRGSMAETPFSQEVCDHLRHQLRSCFLPP